MTSKRGSGPGEAILAPTTAASRSGETEGLRPWIAPAAQPRTRTFRGHRDQLACVREFARAALGPVPVLDEAVLLVSELCTNALLHTASGRNGGMFEVAVYTGTCSARIEVRDEGGSQAPALHPSDALAETGRGLGLVALLSDEWGHHGDHTGRSVFFELRWKEPD